MDIDSDFLICKRCDKVTVVNPAGLCPRCQYREDDARAKVQPCVKCGSVEGRPDPRNGRIKRTRGMCSGCYDAWWDEHRYKTDLPERPEVPVAACESCGTLGGYVDPRTGRPKRTLGRCHLCYAEIHNARRRAARIAANAIDPPQNAPVPPPPELELWDHAEAIRRAHAPKLRTRRRGWRDLTPREASRRVRRLWRMRPRVEAFFASDKLIYD